MDIRKFLSVQPDFIGGNGAINEKIGQAEGQLALVFSPEYREYLSAYGIAAVDGHELTGVCKIKRLNVADVTLEERQQNPSVPQSWYVIEQANIDGIVIWQAESGEIYLTAPNMKPRKIADSIVEYISQS